MPCEVIACSDSELGKRYQRALISFCRSVLSRFPSVRRKAVSSGVYRYSLLLLRRSEMPYLAAIDRRESSRLSKHVVRKSFSIFFLLVCCMMRVLTGDLKIILRN